jgi:hypothetical protein
VKLGDVALGDVSVKIVSTHPLQVEVEMVGEFWADLGFAVGQVLTLVDTGVGSFRIEDPKGLPWFLLGAREGKLYFEHYR